MIGAPHSSHSWAGMIMGFLVKQRHKNRLEHESGITVSRSNSCPQLQADPNNFALYFNLIEYLKWK